MFVFDMICQSNQLRWNGFQTRMESKLYVNSSMNKLEVHPSSKISTIVLCNELRCGYIYLRIDKGENKHP